MDKKIIIAIIGFIIVVLSIIASRYMQSHGMMNATSIEKQNEAQEIIIAKQNLENVSTNNIMSQSTREVIITLPLGTFEKLEKGTVELIRKDDLSKNVQMSIVPNGYNRRTIPKSSLLKGMYKSRIQWWNDGKLFFKEETVMVE